MALKKKQKQALKLLKKGKNVFLSGEAGTGKSFVIEQFKEYLEREGKKYVVAAPTGLAALNIGGVTLHRMFGLSTDALMWYATMKNIEEAEVVIVDEISMCRVDNFQKIARAMIAFEEKPEIEEGDREAEKRELEICRKKQLVVVGDFFQLPPVLKKEEAELLNLTQDRAYAFQCPEWEKFNFQSVVLNEVVRQSNKQFIDNLNKIRRGDPEGLDYIIKNARKKSNPNAIYLCGRTDDADNINYINLNKLKKENNKELHFYKAIESGEVGEADRPTRTTIALCIGARVMCMVNAADEVVNGMLGTVDLLEKGRVGVKFDNGVSHVFEPYKWSIKGFKEEVVEGKKKMVSAEIGTFTQIPLKQAWAITIHKSQGQTYSAVNLNPKSFAPGQLYVGLSRCTTIKKMHITQTIQPSYLKVSEAVKQFYEDIENGVVRSYDSVEEEIVEIDEGEVFEKQISFQNLEQVTFDDLGFDQVGTEKNEEPITELIPVTKVPPVEAKADFISMEIPKHLEKAVLKLIKGDKGTVASSKTEKALQKQIETLQKEVDKLKKSSGRRPKISKEREEEIVKLRMEGLAINKISSKLKCGDGTVRRVMKERGLS